MADAFLDIRLRELQFFERLAALGSLTAAARELQLPKPTASRWLSELERRVGAPLVRRTTRVLVLTPKGAQLARRARSLLAQADAARLALLPDTPGGVLRVSAPVPLGRLIGGAVVARFVRRLPLVRLEVLLSNTRVDLLRDGVDVAIRGGELPDSGLIARRLASSSLWLYASAAFADAELGELPLVVAPGDEALLRRAGVHVADASAVVDDRSAIADALSWGAGLGLLPPFLGEPGCAAKTLVRRGECPVVTLPVHAVFHASQRDDLRVRVLVEEIEAQLQSTF